MTARTSPLSDLHKRWQGLAVREQNLVLIAAALVALALLWWLAVAPAWATLRAAPARHAALDAQLSRMRTLQAEAEQLQSTTRTGAANTGDTAGTLRAALTQRLGTTAQLSVVGDRATVTLKGAAADALAQWLAQARSNARATPIEARLTRTTTTATTSPGASGGAGAPESAAAARALATGAAPVPVPVSNTLAAMPRWDGTLVLVLPASASR